MSDSKSIPQHLSIGKTPTGNDDGSMSETKDRTIIEDTKSRSDNEAVPKELAAAAKPDVVAVGSKLGPYQLVRKLGQGGMGAVYEAQHTKFNKTFVLKVLPPGFAANEASLSRFEREMQAIGKLDHPNIVKATNADEWQGTHYLVMEYVEGSDLSQFVKSRGPLSIDAACDAIRQAALGLQHAHEHGLVHRDIKPSNLFVASPVASVAAFARTRDSDVAAFARTRAWAALPISTPRTLASAATMGWPPPAVRVRNGHEDRRSGAAILRAG